MTVHHNTYIGKPKEGAERACSVYTTQDQKSVIRQQSKCNDSAQRYEKHTFPDNAHSNKQFDKADRFSYQKHNYTNSGYTKCGSWRQNSTNYIAQPSTLPKLNRKRNVIC